MTGTSSGEDRPSLAPRVVFDTVGFVRSLLNPIGPWGAIVFDLTDQYDLVVSQQLLEEVEDVLTRPVFSNRVSVHTERNVRVLLERLHTEEKIDLPNIPRVSRDSKNDHLLALATFGNAQFLVSEDRDLLVLALHGRVKIVDGLKYLQSLRRVAG